MTKKNVKSYLTMAGAALAGAVSMYLLDPLMGNRRRKLIRDKAVHYAHETEDMVEGKSKHLANKARGMAHETKSYVKEEMDHLKANEPETETWNQS